MVKNNPLLYLRRAPQILTLNDLHTDLLSHPAVGRMDTILYATSEKQKQKGHLIRCFIICNRNVMKNVQNKLETPILHLYIHTVI